MAKKQKSTRPKKLNIHFAFQSYGGNGGFSSTHPDVGYWFADTLVWCKSDKRIGNITRLDISDTPVVMVRNRQVLAARAMGADVIVMVDSDQSPDMYVGKEFGAKPFFQSGFDFIWDNYDKYKYGVQVGCPYCGPPPHPVKGGGENVYVFHWTNTSSDDGEEEAFRLDAYSREQASQMAGIQEAGALPTGGIIADMRTFMVTEPTPGESADGGQWKGWYYYEFKDHYAAEKASTEDVTMTRDLSLTGMLKYGYNPVFCNWDSWMGHHKPKCVGKPRTIKADTVGGRLAKAVKDGQMLGDVLVNFSSDYGRDLKEVLPDKHTGKRSAKMDKLINAVQPSNGDQEVIAELCQKACQLVAAGETVFVAEVGTWVGENAKFMAECIRANGRVPEIHCVDHFQGSVGDRTSKIAGEGQSVLLAFCENVGEMLNKEIRLHKGSSVVVAQEDNLPKFHLVYLDAGHLCDEVEADITAWTPHVIEGGYLGGHDYNKGCFPGVIQAVRNMFGEDHSAEATVWHTQIKVKPCSSSKSAKTRTASTKAKTKVSTGSSPRPGTSTGIVRSARAATTAARKTSPKSVSGRKTKPSRSSTSK